MAFFVDLGIILNTSLCQGWQNGHGDKMDMVEEVARNSILYKIETTFKEL